MAEANTSNQPQEQTQEVSALGPTPSIPPFWKSDPALWFIQVESAFATSRITSSSAKYHLVVVNLELAQLQQVTDILQNPSRTPYEDLKARLLNTFEESESVKVRRLLEQTTIGDERPSLFLRSLRQKAGNLVSEELLRNLWLRALPKRMQEILATVDVADLDKLSITADKIAEVEASNIYAVESVTPTKNSAVDILSQQVADLTKKFELLQGQLRRRSRPRTPSRSRNATPDQRNLCFFHRKFGDKARRCIEPCEKQKN
ncbi:uncharacterized protein LOC112127878 [Cimex lectularius]|uniref:DUF7041 domain-containing protein n=1 Tax=Cimex lectularius TaxID=79782 RepID=A0A8I6SN18_CIMLE|nr:uncharacterized protein LOC112127878 [Cimex lectularius]